MMGSIYELFSPPILTNALDIEGGRPSVCGIYAAFSIALLCPYTFPRASTRKLWALSLFRLFLSVPKEGKESCTQVE